MTVWDFFISHASEDKEEIARPLAKALTDLGFEVWFDEFTLKIGDSLSKSIDKGIAASKYGIVILSPSFFEKKWPQRELNSLATLEMIDGEKKILPLWHKLDAAAVAAFSPSLADKFAISTSEGLTTVTKKLVGVLSRPTNPVTEESKDIHFLNTFLRSIIDHLVVSPKNYELRFIEGEKTIVSELIPRTEKDLARIIGKGGKLAESLRRIAGAVGFYEVGKRVVIEIVESPGIIKNLTE